MSPEEISTWISRLSKEDCLYQWGWASPNPLQAYTEQIGRGRVSSLTRLELSHPWTPALGHWLSRFSGLRTQTGTHTISHHPSPPTPILRPLNLNWITALAFQVLQHEGGRSWGFWASSTTWANSCNKTPIYTSTYIPLVLFLWRTLTQIYTQSPLLLKLLESILPLALKVIIKKKQPTDTWHVFHLPTWHMGTEDY